MYAGASSGDAAQSCRGYTPPGPTLLVVGNEGRGLRPVVERHCDTVLHVALGSSKPDMPGAVDSLNVSVAAGILLHQLLESRAEVAAPLADVIESMGHDTSEVSSQDIGHSGPRQAIVSGSSPDTVNIESELNADSVTVSWEVEESDRFQETFEVSSIGHVDELDSLAKNIEDNHMNQGADTGSQDAEQALRA